MTKLFLSLDDAVLVAKRECDIDPLLARQGFEQKCYITEPCEDYISRQSAIYAISHAQVNFDVESEIDFTKHKREVHEIVDGVLDAQEKALKDLPSVQPELNCKSCVFRTGYGTGIDEGILNVLPKKMEEGE